MSLRASPVSHPASPMQVDNDNEQNDASLPFADNDGEPDPPVPDGPLPLAMQPIVNDDLPKYKPFSLGPMKVKCLHCHAFHFDFEKTTKSTRQNPIFGSCCMNGKVILPFLQKPPGQLACLFSGQHTHSDDFLEDAHSFNSAFAFISMGTKIDRSMNVGGAPPVFKIQGALYHQYSQILPLENISVKYAQIYFYQDPKGQLDRCIANNTRPGRKPSDPPIILNPDVMSDIQVNYSVFSLIILPLTFLV
jgi:hypothetical protein